MKNHLIKLAREELEECERFHYWQDAIGLTFDEFSIYDLDSNTFLKEGNRKIGDYTVMIKDGDILSVNYCMKNESVRNSRLKQIL